jgi:hypothetical protein
LTTNTRASSALSWVDGDSLKAFQTHRNYLVVERYPVLCS